MIHMDTRRWAHGRIHRFKCMYDASCRLNPGPHAPLTQAGPRTARHPIRDQSACPTLCIHQPSALPALCCFHSENNAPPASSRTSPKKKQSQQNTPDYGVHPTDCSLILAAPDYVCRMLKKENENTQDSATSSAALYIIQIDHVAWKKGTRRRGRRRFKPATWLPPTLSSYRREQELKLRRC